MATPRMIKRSAYVSDSDSSSCEDVDWDTRYKYGKFDKQTKENNSDYPYRKSKCSSRNAILARENRIKKKIHMEKLEQELKLLKNDNTNLNAIIENQSLKISDLQNEIRYFKSMLANSADLRLLINNIQCSTGMSVSTSLDQSTALDDCVSKQNQQISIARKTAHPWYDELATPNKSSNIDCGMNVNLHSFPEMDILSEEPFPTLIDFDRLDNSSSDVVENSATEEHNYTRPSSEDANDGVCLHVSKHRVSVEFCSSCNDNAIETWKDMD